MKLAKLSMTAILVSLGTGLTACSKRFERNVTAVERDDIHIQPLIVERLEDKGEGMAAGKR